MTRKYLFIICLHLCWINAYSLSTRSYTPYFCKKVLQKIDYIIMGEVIGFIPIDSLYSDVDKLIVIVQNDFDNNLGDTVLLKRCPSNSNYSKDYYKNLKGQYYIRIYKDDEGFFYLPIYYNFLKIQEGYVKASFNGFDVFLERYLMIYFDRKMKIERFERKIKRKMDRIEKNKTGPSKSCEDYLM